MLQPLDKFLLEYCQPFLPEYTKLLGWVVVDDTTLRIWFLDEKGIKKGILVPAPV